MTDLWQKHLKDNWTAFDAYRVRLAVNAIVGGKPATPDMIQKWIDATCKAKAAEDRERIKNAHVETLEEVTAEKADAQSCVFARVDGELAIEGRQVKAMLKEAGNIIKTIAPNGKEEGVTNLRSKVADQVFVVEEYIKLGRLEPDERIERPIHVMTAQGPRDSIKRVEVVRDVEIGFTLRRRRGNDKGSVPERVMLAILDYAQQVGLGADRSQGYGTFKVISVEKL